MNKFDDLRNKNNILLKKSIGETERLSVLVDECYKMSNAFYNAGEIFDKIDKEFSEKTGLLNPKDVSFLFLAIALQCSKWMLMSPMDFDLKPTSQESRLEHTDGDKLVKATKKEYLNKNSSEKIVGSTKYWTWNELIMGPVPYDTINNTKIMGVLGENKGLGGTTHRCYTLGHDPILGWIFGTLNILTRTMTLNVPTLDTYTILKGNICGNITNLTEMVGQSIETTKEDDKRLAASVFKQSIHFESDKFTKLGLQLPFTTPEKAIELINKGWNSVSAENVMKAIGYDMGIFALQAGISMFLNLIIKALHLRFYDETKDGSLSLYEVRTRKILSLSNGIASASNVITIALSTAVPQVGAILKKDIRHLDVGGIMVTIYRLVNDHRFIKKVKHEFVSEEFSKRIFDSNFEWRELQ